MTTLETRAKRLAHLWSKVQAGSIPIDEQLARNLLQFCMAQPIERSVYVSESDVERLRDAVEEAERG